MIRRAFIAAALAFALAGCAPTGALWHMDEPSGTRTVVDDAGDHDGVATDVIFGEPGYRGTAYRFNGATSIVRVPHADDLNPGSGGFSYGAWVNFTELPPERTWDVVRKGVSGSSGGNYKLELYTANGAARARCAWKDGAGITTTKVGGSGLNDGGWHQLRCSRSGDTFSVTVDGVTSSNSATLGSIANTAELTIGAKATDSDVFKGLIDEAQVTFSG